VFPGNPSLQFSTRCAQNLSIDSRDENYFASASGSGEPTVCIWDRRAGSRSSAATLTSGNASGSIGSHDTPVLEYRNCMDNLDASASSLLAAVKGPPYPQIWSVRFCKSRRGAFGVLSNQGQLKVYETAKEYGCDGSGGGAGGSGQSARQTVHQLYTKRCRELQPPYKETNQQQQQQQQQHPVSSRNRATAGAGAAARGGRENNYRVESFDFMASSRADDEYRVLACRCNGVLEVLHLSPQPPRLALSVAGNMTIIAPNVRPGQRHRLLADNREATSAIDVVPSVTLVTHGGATAAATARALRKKFAAACAQHETAKANNAGADANARAGSRRADRTAAAAAAAASEGRRSSRISGHGVSLGDDSMRLAAPLESVKFDIRDVLALGTIGRKRAEEGYLFDCMANIAIVSDEPALQDMWGRVQGKNLLPQAASYLFRSILLR
jgi:hypothetical protein